MRKKRTIATVVISLFVLMNAYGEPESRVLDLDLDRAVELALENNRDLRSREFDLGMRRYEERYAWNVFYPSLVLTGSLSQAWGGAQEGSAADQRNFNAAADLKFKLDASKMTSMRRAALNSKAGSLSYSTSRAALIRNTKNSYYLLLAKRAELELLEENLEIAEESRRKAEAHYNNGLASEINLMNARVALEKLKVKYEQKRVAWRSALLLYKFLLGIDAERDIRISGPLEVEFRRLDEQKMISRGLGESFAVKSKALALEQARLDKEHQAALGRSPSLSMGFNWQKPVNRPFQSGSWSDAKDSRTLNLRVSIPLQSWLPGSATAVSQRVSEMKIAKGAHQLAEAREKAAIEIRNLMEKLNSHEAAMNAQEKNVELAKLSYRMNVEAYDQGTLEFLKVENSRSELYKSEQGLLQEKLNYLTTLANLEYAANINTQEDDYNEN